jgi:hypothetical protein
MLTCALAAYWRVRVRSLLARRFALACVVLCIVYWWATRVYMLVNDKVRRSTSALALVCKPRSLHARQMSRYPRMACTSRSRCSVQLIL